MSFGHRLWWVDAFTGSSERGNPAVVILLERPMLDHELQQIAFELGVSETAFVRRVGDSWSLRWFTPTVEVDLCGHATLAAGHIVFRFIEPGRDSVSFHTAKAGTLIVSWLADMLVMDFPAWPAVPVAEPPGLFAALGGAPREVLRARDHLVVYGRAAEVVALTPDLAALAKVDCWAVIVTAPGDDGIDFVSRFFAPAQGIPEDPVTGSAHCTLVPYWARRLGKTEFEARQLSRRGGALRCALEQDRVSIAGRAGLYLEGRIEV